MAPNSIRNTATQPGDLQVGDVLFLRDGRQVRVDSVELFQERQLTYNFAVDDLHCYAVGDLSVLVHNGCGSRLLGKNLAKSGSARPGSTFQAAHIIPTGAFSNRVQEVQDAIKLAQDKFDQFLPGLRNAEINGFWAEAGHAGTHTNKFFIELGNVFENVNSTPAARNAMNMIWQQIRNGNFL